MLNIWHNWLDMEKHDRAWYVRDIEDEYEELTEAESWLEKWSELSDVVYTVSRARWNGYELESPLTTIQKVVGVKYMIPKYSLRWLFFYRAGKKCGSVQKVTEVCNPKKVHKLHSIADLYDINPNDFTEVCQRQLKYWPLLP